MTLPVCMQQRTQAPVTVAIGAYAKSPFDSDWCSQQQVDPGLRMLRILHCNQTRNLD